MIKIIYINATTLDNKRGSIIRRVTYQETDRMGVVHHANYVSWFEVARTEWMRSIGIAYSQIEDSGLMLPLRHLEIDYRKAVLYDAEVKVYCWIDSFSAVMLKFGYAVKNMAEPEDPDHEGEVLVSGSTTHIWIDKNWKTVRIDRSAPGVLNIIQAHGPNQEIQIKQ